MSSARRPVVYLAAAAMFFVGSAIVIAARSRQKTREFLADARSTSMVPKTAQQRHLKGGNLLMGRGTVPPDGPEHIARVDKFAIDLTEVPVAAYRACVDAGRCSPASTNAGCSATLGDEALPITCVSHEQAKAYCAFVGRRLPREAEWEIAARTPGGWPFIGGIHKPIAGEACFAQKKPCPIASHIGDRSGEGTLDMAGSVREWVEESYCDYDGKGCSTSEHVVRGGSWQNADGEELRATVRGKASEPSATIGFRCASSM